MQSVSDNECTSVRRNLNKSCLHSAMSSILHYSLTYCFIAVFSGVIYRHHVVLRYHVCISLTADGSQRARLPIPPIATSPSWLWSLSIFPSFPSPRLRAFIAKKIRHSYTSLTLIELCLLVHGFMLPLRNNRTHDSALLTGICEVNTNVLGRRMYSHFSTV